MKKILSVLILISITLVCFGCYTKVEIDDDMAVTEETEDLTETAKHCVGRLRPNNIVDEEELSDKVKNNYSLDGEFSEKLIMNFYDDLTSALLSIDRGDIESILLTAPTARYIIKQNPGKYKITNNKLENTTLSFAMATLNTNSEIHKKIDSAIKVLKANGTIKKLEDKYLGDGDIVDDIDMPHFDGANTIKVVVTGDLPPMDYVSPTGSAEGYNVALLSEISKILNTNIELIASNTGSRVIMLTSGKADAIFWVSTMKNDKYDEGFDTDVTKDMLITEIYSVQDVVRIEKA